MNCRQMNAWIYYGGGQKLPMSSIRTTTSCRSPARNTGTQMGGWFRKEIKSLADCQGVKMRIAGLGGAVHFAALGMVPQQIPGSDIYPALERAPSTPPNGLVPTTTKSWASTKWPSTTTYPGWWEPGPTIHFFVNKDQVGPSCRKDYQSAFQAAAYRSQRNDDGGIRPQEPGRAAYASWWAGLN